MKLKVLSAVNRYPGTQYQRKDPMNIYVKKRSRDIRPSENPPYEECIVLKREALTRVFGQIIEAGQTRKRRRSPPKENPKS